MSGAKRHAWLRIYNDFLDSRDSQVVKAAGSGVAIAQMNPSAHDAVTSDQDFYELFRGWEGKQLDPNQPDVKYARGLQVGTPPKILSEAEGASVSDELEMPFARDPELHAN